MYRYITIVEKLPGDFVTSMSQIGMTKLTLLASLDDTERAEITEKTDIESASVRELKNEIDRLKAENDERHKDNMSLSRRVGSLQAQNADLQASNEELEDQIEELKARPPKQVIIQQSAKTPDDCVTHQAFEAACDRYQEQIDALESENLQLTRKAYAEKGPPSKTDLEAFASASVLRIFGAVGNNGKTYFLEKTEEYDYQKFAALIGKHKGMRDIVPELRDCGINYYVGGELQSE